MCSVSPRSRRGRIPRGPGGVGPGLWEWLRDAGAGAPRGGGGSGCRVQARGPATAAFGGCAEEMTWEPGSKHQGGGAESYHERDGTRPRGRLPVLPRSDLAEWLEQRPYICSMGSTGGRRLQDPDAPPLGLWSHWGRSRVMAGTPDTQHRAWSPSSPAVGPGHGLKAPARAPVSGAWHVTVNTRELLLKTWVILYLKILHIA